MQPARFGVMEAAVIICPFDCAFSGGDSGEDADSGHDGREDDVGMHVGEVDKAEARLEVSQCVSRSVNEGSCCYERGW